MRPKISAKYSSNLNPIWKSYCRPKMCINEESSPTIYDKKPLYISSSYPYENIKMVLETIAYWKKASNLRNNHVENT